MECYLSWRVMVPGMVRALLQGVVYKHTPRVGTNQASREISHWGIPVGGRSEVGTPSGISPSHQLPQRLRTSDGWYRTFCWSPPQWNFLNATSSQHLVYWNPSEPQKKFYVSFKIQPKINCLHKLDPVKTRHSVVLSTTCWALSVKVVKM